jgi:hypothetical protein
MPTIPRSKDPFKTWFRKFAPYDLSWQEKAACAGMGVQHFFDVDGAPGVCQQCPVRIDCLEHGLNHERFGVWGGLTQEDLKRLRKARGIPLSTRF